MITNGALITFYISIIGLVLIVSRNLRTNRSHLINKIYVAFSMILIEWMTALIGMRFTAPGDEIMLYIWDALSNFGTSMAPVLLLLIALVFTHHYDSLPKKVRGLFIVPVLTNIMIWTNPLHHLHYYMVEVTPLIMNKVIVGFSVIYKDVTKLKESMQKLQNSQKRMMERERLASLGQMVGGIAHNLKTPIMSIAGALNAMDDLVDECQRSFGDPEVTPADYKEIAQEMTDWIHRCKDSCSYMSDIITAVKGQAASMNASDKVTFTPEELLRRTTLLMRHELTVHNCQLIAENCVPPAVVLHGDINNLVQIVNNFIANAIDAQLPQSDHTIRLKIWQEDDQLSLSVSDHGSGISDSVRRHLLKEMITSKGTAGAGLGLYMSKALIQGKFDGELWFNDNPGGGAVFGFTIPLNSEVLQEENLPKSEERSPF